MPLPPRSPWSFLLPILARLAGRLGGLWMNLRCPWPHSPRCGSRTTPRLRHRRIRPQLRCPRRPSIILFPAALEWRPPLTPPAHHRVPSYRRHRSFRWHRRPRPSRSHHRSRHRPRCHQLRCRRSRHRPRYHRQWYRSSRVRIPQPRRLTLGYRRRPFHRGFRPRPRCLRRQWSRRRGPPLKISQPARSTRSGRLRCHPRRWCPQSRLSPWPGPTARCRPRRRRCAAHRDGAHDAGPAVKWRGSSSAGGGRRADGRAAFLASRRRVDAGVPSPVSASPAWSSVVTGPSADGQPVSAPPASAWSVSAPPVLGQPTEAPRSQIHPVSAPPVSAPPVSAPPVSAPPVSGPTSGPPGWAPPVSGPPSWAPPPTERTTRQRTTRQRAAGSVRARARRLTGQPDGRPARDDRTTAATRPDQRTAGLPGDHRGGRLPIAYQRTVRVCTADQRSTHRRTG